MIGHDEGHRDVFFMHWILAVKSKMFFLDFIWD